MTDIILNVGEASPSDIRLNDPIPAQTVGIPIHAGGPSPRARQVYCQSLFMPLYVAAAAAAGVAAASGWQKPLSVPLPPAAKAQAGFSSVPLDTAQLQLSVNFTNFGWHSPLSTPAPVAKAQAGSSFVPFNTVQITAASGIPLNMGDAGPSYRTVYYQSNFVPPYVAPAVVAAYTNFWLQPLSTAMPVARAVSDFGSLPFTTFAVPYGWQSALSTAPLVAKAPFAPWQLPYSVPPVVTVGQWQQPLSSPLPLPKAQAGTSDVPYNTAQLAVNYTNFGWHAPLAGAPLVAKAQPGSSFVPFNTAQLIVNYTNFGWYQPLSVAAAVAKPIQGNAFVPYNTAQLSVNYSNFTWSQPLSAPAPVAQAKVGSSFVPYNTAQVVVAAYTNLWQQPLSVAVPVAKAAADFGSLPYFTPAVVSVAWLSPLSIAPAVASAPAAEWPLPYSVTTVVSLQWQSPLSGAVAVSATPQSDFVTLPPYTTPVVVVYVPTLEWQPPLAKPAPLAAPASVGFSFVPFDTVQVAVEPPETGTILMPGKAGGGGFTRKRWREIQEQEAAERRALLAEQKQARDAAAQLKAAAQAARAAKIAAKADVVAERTRLEAVVLASDTAKQFADQSSKEEAEFLAAMLAEIANQEDEDEAIMLLVGF